MVFQDDFIEPKMISYLDVYVVLNKQTDISKDLEVICDKGVPDSILMGLSAVPFEEVKDCLWELGVNINKEVEEKYCYHRPKCLALSSKNANTPVLYGLAYFGEERNDQAWVDLKRNGN